MTHYLHHFGYNNLDASFATLEEFIEILKSKDLYRKRTELTFKDGDLKIRVGLDYSYVTQFPGNCSWLVWHHLPGTNTLTKHMAKIVEELARYLQYYKVFASHTLNSSEVVWLMDIGYTKVLENVNYHSNKTVVLVCKDFPVGD